MIRGVLFDLDGTLADTAPDLGLALNLLLERYGRETVPLERLRPQASHGARGLLQVGFEIRPGEPYYEELRDEFLEIYSKNLLVRTTLFHGVPELLATLESRSLPWGIVTNKIRRFTDPLVKKLDLDQRAACVVSGDTYARPKPYPDPLIGAADELNLPPDTLVYVGDDERDMRAGLAAGMRVVAARYGYLGSEAPPEEWNAHALIDSPMELIGFLDSVS
jgi:N-acetyl-D-muramate 6-phosphate phosphatase